MSGRRTLPLLLILTWDLERWGLGIHSNGCKYVDYRTLMGN